VLGDRGSGDGQLRGELSHGLRPLGEAALNAEAGEDIRVLHRGEHTIAEARFIGRDFWIVDGEQVVLMHYDAYGRFEGAELAPPAERRAFHDTRDMAWDLAEPFVGWWARHPELHRNVAV
jgi:hypothetical protein